jgi:hypothetical protein
VAQACKVARVARTTAYRARQRDERFALKWADLEQRSTELLERAAYRRAAVGVERPVYYKGERVDVLREYSDTLLMFLLRARKPEIYREQHVLEHTGPGGGPVEVEALGINLDT